MAGEGGIVDRLVVAVDYAYDEATAAAIEADFGSLISLGGDVSSAAAAIGASARAVASDVANLASIAAAALAGLATSAAVAGDEAHDMGIRMGLSAEEVTVLTYATDRAGTSVEVLSRGLTTLQRGLGAAREGAGPAVAALQRLRIDPRAFSTATELLPVMADALANIADEGERANLRLVLLGEAGPQLAEFLDMGSAGLGDLTDRARSLGVAIDDADAELSGDFLDSLSDLGEIASGTGRKIGFTVLPSLARITKGMRDWYLANDDVIGQQIDRLLGGIGYALDQLQTPVGKAVAGALALRSAWGAAGAAKAIYDAAAASSPLIAALGGQAAGAAAAAKSAGPLALAIVAAGLAIDDFVVAAENGDSVLLDLGEAMGARGETQQAAAALIDLLDAGTEAAWAFAGALEVGLGDAIDKLIEKLPSLEPLLKPLRELLDVDAKGFIGAVGDQFERSAKGLRMGADALRGAPRGYGGAYDSSGNARGAGVEFTGSGLMGIATDPLQWAARAIASSVQVNVNGSSPEEVARMAGEAARREVEIQTLETLSAVGMPP